MSLAVDRLSRPAQFRNRMQLPSPRRQLALPALGPGVFPAGQDLLDRIPLTACITGRGEVPRIRRAPVVATFDMPNATPSTSAATVQRRAEPPPLPAPNRPYPPVS